MNKPINSLGRKWLRALCVVSICLGGAACSDDYFWDDGNPDWLGTSIYDYLNKQGNYTNFVKLIDDLDYSEVLAKTGSKTLFVADDEAFEKFYQDNPWGVKNYNQLTLAQKKLLLNSAMINNAYLVEMMSSTVGPEKGQCLRRETALSVTDSVPYFTADQLPTSYNPDDKDYWERFRDPEKGGIHLALDATVPMMTHFIAEQMGMNNIKDSDFEIIMGKSREKSDAYIYDCKIIEKDITCQNGYINKLDKVLVNPQNMAEVLRTNGRTNLFSHMIERFSAPFYNADLTYRYQLLYGNDVDSVFQKRYFSKYSQGYAALNNDRGTNPQGDPNGSSVPYYLNFDPGWNTFVSDDKSAKEEDMGVIFAPSDKKLFEYFFAPDGGGRFLLEAYAPDQLAQVKSIEDIDTIYKALDQIPLTVIQALTNNLMKPSFINAVPSKFETIKDDAQDPMLDETHLPFIEDVLIANNGIIYLMDEVLTPARYAAVSAPAYVGTDMHIFNYAINQDNLDIQTNFYAYLLAMSSRFSFFVPGDEGFWYIDPVSFALATDETRALFFEWDDAKHKPKCTAYEYIYDYTTGSGEIGEPIASSSISDSEMLNRLRDMLETHTIVHEDNTDGESTSTGLDETKTGIECDKHFFIAKNGAPVIVTDATKRQNGAKIQGGWQYERGEYSTVIRFDDKTKETNGNGNGMAYELDKPLQPTIESVYSVMYNDKDDFGEFFNLCQTDVDVLNALGITTTAEQKKYTVFINDNGLPCYDHVDGSKVTSATNVKYFNNYRYTVYVPTNEAVLDAIDRGLPTWEQLREMLYLDEEDETLVPEWTEEEEDSIRTLGIAKVTALINFIKNHFQDNSVFADDPVLAPTQYETATLQVDEEGNPTVYCKVEVSSKGNGTLSIKDAAGHVRNITESHNLLTRDYTLNSSSNPTAISASSFAVVHGIDGVLDYKKHTNNRYDADFKNQAQAKKYLKKYRITE